MFGSKLIVSSLILSITVLFHEVKSICRLQILRENKPLLTQKFGLKERIIQSTGVIEFNDNDEIQAYCASGFTPFEVYTTRRNTKTYLPNERILQFYCRSNKVKFNNEHAAKNSPFYDEHNDDIIPTYEIEFSDQILPKCNGAVYSVFESKNKLQYCEDASSCVVGAKLNTPIIIAGFCYDLDELKLKHVSYKLHEPSSLLERLKQFYPIGLNSNSLSIPLHLVDDIITFPSDLKAETNFWLEIANYELNNIVQTTTGNLKSILDEFADFFDIIWWRNLRTGNWRRFIKLLDKRSKDIKYNVYTGTSGKLRIPIEKQKCENASSMELEMSVPAVIPQFVWTYLHSTSEETVDDFVVVAFNSPYFEYFDNSTVICNDMCNEIDWLQPLQNSRHLVTFGKLYCCRSDEVVGLLDGFPLKPSNQKKLPTEASV